MADGVEQIAMPVSYTHLDVYKRQRPPCVRAPGAALRPRSYSLRAMTHGSSERQEMCIRDSPMTPQKRTRHEGKLGQPEQERPRRRQKLTFSHLNGVVVVK